MKLTEQCKAWHEAEEYQKIVDTIEALPDEERTPELDCELARAYNNIGDAQNRQCYETAIACLKRHEDYFQGDHRWNFRMAYAYYYLDEEGVALHYFKQALAALPDDEDTQEFIADCRSRLVLPRFDKTFRERTAECWALFEQREQELRELLDAPSQSAVAEKLVATCRELLSPAFAGVNFELGKNGVKYELILTPGGNQAKLFSLVYFQQHAPKSVLEHWNILVGRQPSKGFSLRYSGFDQEICAKDVLVWVEKLGDSSQNAGVGLTLYCEKLLPLLRDQDDLAQWMLYNLTDQVIGEILAIRYIDMLDVVDKPKPEPAGTLEDLPQILEAMGLEQNLDPQHYLDHAYKVYEMEPEEDPNTDWRLDVFAGATRCPAIINGYLSGEDEVMDSFHREGAVPGFLCYPLDCFDDEADRSAAILDFRDGLEDAVLEKAGVDAVTFLGGASGIYYGYLDFIAWDLDQVLDAAFHYFKNSPVNSASFHTFRREVASVALKSEASEDSQSQ